MRWRQRLSVKRPLFIRLPHAPCFAQTHCAGAPRPAVAPCAAARPLLPLVLYGAELRLLVCHTPQATSALTALPSRLLASAVRNCCRAACLAEAVREGLRCAGAAWAARLWGRSSRGPLPATLCCIHTHASQRVEIASLRGCTPVRLGTLRGTRGAALGTATADSSPTLYWLGGAPHRWCHDEP